MHSPNEIRNIQNYYVVSTNNPPDDLPACCVCSKNLSPKEVAEVNNSARVSICSSLEEGFGLLGLEAMAR